MRRWLSLGVILLLLALVVTTRVQWLSVNQPLSDMTVWVENGSPARQTILNHHPGLMRASFEAFEPLPPPDQTIRLAVRDAESGRTLFEIGQTMAALTGPCLNPCGTGEASLRFVLPTDGVPEERALIFEVATEGQPLGLAAHSPEAYSSGELLDSAAPGDLVFRLDYNGPVGATLLSLARATAVGRPGIAGNPFWVPAWVAAYVVVLGAALSGFRKLAQATRAEDEDMRRGPRSAVAASSPSNQPMIHCRKLVIQIPCLNEADTLPTTLAALPRQIPGVDEVAVLVIDDGSTDDTVAVARAHGVEHIVRHPMRRGLAAAFESGLETALAIGADIIVNTDGDNQYPGESIPDLVAPILAARADLVVGDRKPGFNPEFSWSKRLLQRVGSWVVAQAAGTPVPDATSGFRAYTRDAALRLQLFTRYTYTLETLIQASKKGLRVAHVEVPVNPVTRPSRLMRSQWEYVKRSAATILRLYAIYEPLRTFGLLSLPFILVGLALLGRFAAFYLLGYLNDGVARLLQSVFIGGTSLIIGILILIFGLLADLIAANRRLTEETLYRLKRVEFERRFDWSVNGLSPVHLPNPEADAARDDEPDHSPEQAAS